jgi:hypothetical protein
MIRHRLAASFSAPPNIRPARIQFATKRSLRKNNDMDVRAVINGDNTPVSCRDGERQMVNRGFSILLRRNIMALDAGRPGRSEGVRSS